jgi:uncharacterized membrane protein
VKAGVMTGSRRPGHAIDVKVTIRRPRDDVFQLYRDFRNLPRFLGDVMAVEIINPRTSRWTIQGPFGIQLSWITELMDERVNELIRYQTGRSRWTRTIWEIHFAAGPDDGETEVREIMTMPFGRLGQAALTLFGKYPAAEVHANLHRLKEFAETGEVTDRSYAVAGKFASKLPASRR